MLQTYVYRAKTYRDACGCAMGGVFFLLALGSSITYAVLHHQLSTENGLMKGIFLIAASCGAALLGKIVGIGVARLRLFLLERELLRRYPMMGS